MSYSICVFTKEMLGRYMIGIKDEGIDEGIDESMRHQRLFETSPFARQQFYYWVCKLTERGSR